MTIDVLRTANRQDRIFSFAYSPVFSGVPQSFGHYLRLKIDDLELDYSEFAKRSGVSPTHLSDVMADRRALNPKHLQRFIDELGLSGRERDLFFDLAIIRHLKPAVRPYFHALLERIRKREEA